MSVYDQQTLSGVLFLREGYSLKKEIRLTSSSSRIGFIRAEGSSSFSHHDEDESRDMHEHRTTGTQIQRIMKRYESILCAWFQEWSTKSIDLIDRVVQEVSIALVNTGYPGLISPRLWRLMIYYIFPKNPSIVSVWISYLMRTNTHTSFSEGGYSASLSMRSHISHQMRSHMSSHPRFQSPKYRNCFRLTEDEDVVVRVILFQEILNRFPIQSPYSTHNTTWKKLWINPLHDDECFDEHSVMKTVMNVTRDVWIHSILRKFIAIANDTYRLGLHRRNLPKLLKDILDLSAGFHRIESLLQSQSTSRSQTQGQTDADHASWGKHGMHSDKDVADGAGEYVRSPLMFEDEMAGYFRISMSLLFDLFLVLYRDRVEESLTALVKAKLDTKRVISTIVEVMVVPALRECFQWFDPNSMDEYDCRWVESILEKIVRIPMEAIDDEENGSKWKTILLEEANMKEQGLQFNVIEKMISSISSSISETRSRLK